MCAQGMEIEHLRSVASGLQQRLDESLHAIPIIREVNFRTVFPKSAQSRKAILVQDNALSLSHFSRSIILLSCLLLHPFLVPTIKAMFLAGQW